MHLRYYGIDSHQNPSKHYNAVEILDDEWVAGDFNKPQQMREEM